MKSTASLRRFRWAAALALSAIASILSATSALATPLPALTPLGSPITSSPGLGGGGATIATLTSPFTAIGLTFTGTLKTTVIRNDAANPFGTSDGYLTFVYDLTQLTSTEGDPLQRMTIGNFNDSVLTTFPIPLDASYLTPLLSTIAPTTMDRTLSNGRIVGFGFTINAGETLASIVVHAKATSFRSGTASVIDGDVASLIPVYTPVPEPTALLLGSIGVGALLVSRRRCRPVA
jgi:hypothetical protein